MLVLLIWVTIGVLFVLFLNSVERRSRGLRASNLRVEVGQSSDDGRRLQHTISARIRDNRGTVIHYKRVDMRDEDWEEQLAIKVADMKHKLRVLEAAQRNASEINQ